MQLIFNSETASPAKKSVATNLFYKKKNGKLGGDGVLLLLFVLFVLSFSGALAFILAEAPSLKVAPCGSTTRKYFRNRNYWGKKLADLGVGEGLARWCHSIHDSTLFPFYISEEDTAAVPQQRPLVPGEKGYRGHVPLSYIRPMPVPTISTRKNNPNKPPSPVITSPESLKWVKQHDNDYNSPSKGAEANGSVKGKGAKGKGKTTGAAKDKAEGGPKIKAPAKAKAKAPAKRAPPVKCSTSLPKIARPTPKPRQGELGTPPQKPLPLCNGRDGFFCQICQTRFGEADCTGEKWVFCMTCISTLHRDCLGAYGACTCGFKVKRNQLGYQ